jgi:hypothetical protein
MNVKQLFAIVTLLTAAGSVMAQAPGSDKPADNGQHTHKHSADGKAWTESKSAASKKPSSQHDHKEDGPKKSVYSGA